MMRKFLLSLVWAVMVMPMEVSAQTVSYNTNSGKYHKIECKWAKKCTKNCIHIHKDEAIKRGGVPCKVCGG